MNFHLISGIAVASMLATSAANTAPVSAAVDVNTTRVVVMRVQELSSKGVRATVIRKPGTRASHDFILVDKSTTAADLAKAVATLMYSRRIVGPQTQRELRADISAAPSAKTAAPRAKSAAARDEQRAVRDLARLPRAAVISIKGVGRGPAIAITTAQVPQKKK